MKTINTIKTVYITGASSGIGRASALRFALGGYRVIINGRRETRLNELAARIKAEYDVDAFVSAFDIRDWAEVENAIDNIPVNWKKIDVLINNAGLAAGLDPMQTGQKDDWDQMIDTNIKGLLNVTRKLVPGMIERASGHIINIGSIAGKEVYPNGNIYCATKHAVDALTKAMRIDLLKHNIRVSQIAPGAVETEFSEVRFKGDKEAASKVYNGFTPLTAEDVAEAIWFVASRPSHVNINDLLIMPNDQANSGIINRK